MGELVGVENPASWNVVEKTIYKAMREHQQAVQSRLIGISLVKKIYNTLAEEGYISLSKKLDSGKKWEILGVDHVAIAVKDIEFWKKVYIDLLGGKIVHEALDADPGAPSSMKLCGIKLGGYSVALIEGIDREEESQVSVYMRTHGDHSYQHVAVAVTNLHAFVEDAEANGFQFLGPILEREDLFGPIRQVFAKRFDGELDAAEGAFYEFVERPVEGSFAETAGKSFSNDFARDLYRQIEVARQLVTDEQFITLPSERE